MARFYRADGSLVVEGRERRYYDTLNPGERTQFNIAVDREDTRGWAYFLVTVEHEGTEVPCAGCDEVHAPPAPGPCGIPFDEAIAVTWQCSRDRWTASGPVQNLGTCWDTEADALELVTTERDGFFLERIGTADLDGGWRGVQRGTRLWRAGYVLAPYDRDLRDQLSNISCFR